MSSRTMLKTSSRVGVITLFTLGCATATRETARDPRPTVSLARDATLTPPPRRMSDVLTSTEIAASPTLATAHDAINRLRPWFLRQRSARTLSTPGSYERPAVFVDGAFQGEIDILRTIPIHSVLEIQFLRPVDAVHRYGPEYQSGIIFIRTRR
jgi:hypothetical protein